jgi:unsaturated rhamnogalacturonyl hydrolase
MSAMVTLETQLEPLGAQIAPFIQARVRDWQPYRPHWNYEDGCIFKGCLDLAAASGEQLLAQFVHREVSARVAASGAIAGFDPLEFNIDNVHAGKALFGLFERTGEPRFRRALDVQFSQLVRHPRTASGNYWHKQIYPWQVWLDGLYMAQPFQLAYALLIDDAALIEDSRRQFEHVRTVMRDDKTGLYYHGWDERRLERWSNPQTGCSPCFWARAMGWFAMALIDCIEVLQSDARSAIARVTCESMLREVADALLAVQSPGHLWFQVLDQAGRERNYEEASASLMFSCSLMKGTRLGVLTAGQGAAGRRAYEACVRRFLGAERLDGICGVAGLGNVPYRDGSYDYYMSEPIVPNDPKGVGAFLLATAEALVAGR